MAAPAFASFVPSIVNTGTHLYVSLPLGNSGSATAPSVWLTGGTLGSAPLLSPSLFRIFVGDLAVGNNTNVNLIFGAAALTVGSRYLLTVRGTYGSGSTISGFTVNRFLVVPSVTSLPVPFLSAAASVAIGPDSWTYSLTNSEPVGSTLFIASFSLDITAPASITASPAGWIGKTDNTSYVAWYADDTALPYPHQVAPGATLGGFAISSATALSRATAYIVTSWDHASNETGLVFSDYIASPSPT